MNHCYDMPIDDMRKKHLTDLLPGTVVMPHVPTFNSSIIVNDKYLGEQDGWDDGVTGLVAEISDDRSQFTFTRADGAPIQILNVHGNTPTQILTVRDKDFGMVFADPVDAVQINKLEDGVWAADIDPENVRNKSGLVCFVHVIAQVALAKQTKLQAAKS